MNDAEKRPFIEMLAELTQLPLMKAPDTITKPIASMYWTILQNRELDEVRIAINEHMRDPERGRFFPTPADIEHKLPQRQSLWPSADEAWAMLPKDEYSSGAMCHEMASGLALVEDLIRAGDLIAARRSFIDHYNRKVGEAKTESIRPAWWPSLGMDKDGYHKAKAKVVELQNLALPPSKRKALPANDPDPVGIEHLMDEAVAKSPDPEVTAAAKEELYKLLGMKKEVPDGTDSA